MSSLDRMLNLLNAFKPEAPIHTSDDLIRLVRASRATGYRYLSTLERAGLISAVGNGSYTLGPRIPQLDRLVRQCDPLLLAGGPVLRRLTKATKHTSILCALYTDQVMCICDERSEDSPAELFNRGQVRPLFTAAASKIILAHLAPHQLRRVYRNNATDIATAGLGTDWNLFLAALRKLRAQGYAYTVGEFNPGIAGISAPVFNKAHEVVGSIGLAMTADQVNDAALKRFSRLAMDAGGDVTAALSNTFSQLDRQPRAIGRSRSRER